MRRRVKKVALWLLCLCMMLPTILFGGVEVDENGVPSEVVGKEYVEIPVMQDGKVVQVITQELEKNGQKGTVYFGTKAYAYKTGSEIKIGVRLTYYAQDGTRPVEFFDAITVSDQNTINWPSCTGAYIATDKPMEFDGPNANQKRIIVYFKASNGNTFYRHTEKDVAFDKGFDSVMMKVMNGGTTEKDSFGTILDPLGPLSNQKVFATPLPVKKDSTVKVNLEIESSELSRDPVYQVITSETCPTLPVTMGSWEKLGELAGATYNEKEYYEDYVAEGGYISAQHYIYSPGFEKSPNDYGEEKRDRAEVFKYPVNEIVKQSTLLNGNNKYSTQEGAQAFFVSSKIDGGTELWADFVPEVSGEYRFCVYSRCGAYGTIEINGEQRIFVNNDSIIGRDGEPYYHRTNDVFQLEAGKSYKVYLKTRHISKYDTSPCLMYAIKPSTGWPTASNHNHNISNNKHSGCGLAAEEDLWRIVTPNILKNQNPSNGASRAVKLWGFIEPDQTGKYNFGLLADDAAYGYLIVGNEKKVFVDNMGLSKPVDQSNGLEVQIEAGKVYPFYVEWYEGCPAHQALTPRYRKVGGNWKDIPNEWFHPSSSTIVANVPEAMYEVNAIDKEIEIPNAEGNHYIVLKIVDKNGIEHQLLYGAFTHPIGLPVDQIQPVSDSKSNYLVPESVSNVTAEVTFKTPAKKLIYTIDLNSLWDIEVSGDKAFSFDLNSAVIQLDDGSGKQIITDTGTYKKEVRGNTLIISRVDEEAVIEKEQYHKIVIYIPTSFKEQVIYNKVVGRGDTYKDLIDAINDYTIPPVVVSLKVSRLQKIKEAVIVEGEIYEPEVYSSVPSEDLIDIPIKLCEMTKIN